MKKSAFTLIELLVVIAIIAILAGIALPVFGQVQERGKATSDASNLRQLGIGTTAYLSDHDDTIFTKSKTGSDTAWPLLLQDKYVPNWKAFRSPFDRVTAARPEVATAPGVPISYGINTNIINPSGDFDGNVAKYTAPSQLVYMAPAVDTAAKTLAFPAANKSETWVDLPVPKAATAKKDYRGTHSNRSQINVLFADNHVESVVYRDYSDAAKVPEGKQRWEPAYQPTP